MYLCIYVSIYMCVAWRIRQLHGRSFDTARPVVNGDEVRPRGNHFITTDSKDLGMSSLNIFLCTEQHNMYTELKTRSSLRIRTKANSRTRYRYRWPRRMVEPTRDNIHATVCREHGAHTYQRAFGYQKRTTFTSQQTKSIAGEKMKDKITHIVCPQSLYQVYHKADLSRWIRAVSSAERAKQHFVPAYLWTRYYVAFHIFFVPYVRAMVSWYIGLLHTINTSDFLKNKALSFHADKQY